MNSLKEFFYDLITDKKSFFWLFPFYLILSLYSIIYFFIIKFLIFFHSNRKEKFGIKVISVGNLTWGGTGKTPLVERVANDFREKGEPIAVVMRKDLGILSDEVIMLSQRLKGIPIIVEKNKKMGIKRAVGYGVNIVVLDDGFQQWGIEKDLDIVVIDSLNPFGNGWLIPRGILREPLSSLKRADIFILNKVDLVEGKNSLEDLRKKLRKINKSASIFNAFYSPKYLFNLITDKEESLNILKGKEICIFSGIASPISFRSTVEKLGCNIKLFFEFLDHYPYKEADLFRICNASIKDSINILVTTEKDALRLPFIKKIAEKFPLLNIFSLVVELKILELEEFYARLSLLSNN